MWDFTKTPQHVPTASKQQGHVGQGHGSRLLAVIRPVEGFIVTCLKIFVYCEIGVAEHKLDHSTGLFGVVSFVNFWKVKYDLLGTSKFTF